jgi:hypothetical protein
MRTLFLMTVVLATPGLAKPAAAQRGGWGLLFQQPVAIGVLLNAGDKLGVRAEGNFSTSKNETGGTTFSFHSWTAGLSTLHYAGAPADLRTYVSPRFTYSRTTGESGSSTLTTDGFTLGLSFGAQAKLGTRISAYAETGLAYSSSKNGTAPTDQKTTGFGTRSAVGLILFFGK